MVSKRWKEENAINPKSIKALNILKMCVLSIGGFVNGKRDDMIRPFRPLLPWPRRTTCGLKRVETRLYAHIF